MHLIAKLLFFYHSAKKKGQKNDFKKILVEIT